MSRDRVLNTLLAVVALSVFITPVSRELFVGDETKYAQVVREMRAGAFFLPTLEGTPFTHKPPLHFWIVDLLTVSFGLYSIWAFVLPSIVAFLVLLWLMWRMEGPVAAFVCGTSLLIWGSAQTARMDVTFTAMLVAAAWMLQKFFDEASIDKQSSDNQSPPGAAAPHLIYAGIWTGLATLVKGPMAPVIVLFLFGFEWLRRKRVPRGPYAIAILAMVVIPLLWFVPAMVMGGQHYTNEVLVKQTAGRAVGAWTHRSPFWFYLAHAPGDLFPWFLLAVVAIIAAYRRVDARAKFAVSWVLAVLVPYSLLSSKLDVYMMAMVPPVALLIARLLRVEDIWSNRGRIANAITLSLLLLCAIAGPFIQARGFTEELRLTLFPFFLLLGIVSAAGLVASVITPHATLASTLGVGLAPLAMFIGIGLFLMPLANEMASDRPMVRALIAQNVAPEATALYWAPHVWTRDMPPDLARVRYVSAEDLRKQPATLIVTSRKRAEDIEDVLRGYRKVDQFQMIGKWFDVYRR